MHRLNIDLIGSYGIISFLVSFYVSLVSRGDAELQVPDCQNVEKIPKMSKKYRKCRKNTENVELTPPNSPP
jgi:hypothetical protein